MTPVRFLAVAASLLVLVTAAAACAESPRETLEGALLLTDLHTESEPCRGTGALSNEREGKELRMQEGTDEHATPIDTAVFSEGELTQDGCEFTFEFEVPEGFEEYTIINCFEDDEECQTIGYSWADLVELDFFLDYCLGTLCAYDLDEGSQVDRDGGGIAE